MHNSLSEKQYLWRILDEAQADAKNEAKVGFNRLIKNAIF
jgi:hypothetical protein